MTDATPPYEQWTVTDLRDELRGRGLPTSGSRLDLAARLYDADRDADREPADLTVDELKDELRARDQPVSGTKDELVERLTDAPDHLTQTAEQQERTRARTAADTPADPAARGECVVDDGTAHMGRATPGAKICSAHAMHYKADGTPRSEDVNAR